MANYPDIATILQCTSQKKLFGVAHMDTIPALSSPMSLTYVLEERGVGGPPASATPSNRGSESTEITRCRPAVMVWESIESVEDALGIQVTGSLDGMLKAGWIGTRRHS